MADDNDGPAIKRIGQYVIGEKLGSGSFGKVFRAEHALTKHVVAVKIINREKVKNLDMMGKIKREIQILKLFRHPHIIKLYQVISSPKDILMVMEYVSGGELFDYIIKHGRLSEKEGRRFFQQIISGVEYCHRHMVVHRDLKPENVLLDAEGNVKIADFGLSNIMRDGDFLQTSCGSPNYAAPEVISGQLYAGPEVDVWSCGVILFVLLCGKLPFDDELVGYLFKKIRGGIFSLPPYLSNDAKDLISLMLKVNPLERATIPQIREHAWFKEDLPPSLFAASHENSSRFEESIIEEVCERFQVYREQLLDALQKGDKSDQLYIAYDLLANSPLRAAPISTDEQGFSDSNFLRPGLSYSAVLPDRLELPAEQWKTSQKRVIKKSRWHLGMRSQNKPEEVMAEVFRAMKSLNFQWKVVNPYHARCRVWNQVSGTMIKMSLQLYRADEKNYLLDFKNLPDKTGSKALNPEDDDNDDTHTLEFFELCAMLISELGR